MDMSWLRRMTRFPTLGDRDRRALLLGLAVLAPALIWALVLSPYLGAVRTAGERVVGERELLRRELELLARAAEYPLAFEQGSARLLEAARTTFAGDNPAMASAALAQYVQAEARASRVLLTRLEPLPAEEAGPDLISLPLRVHGETDLEGLLTLLQTLERGSKLVRVDDLRIQGVRTAAAAVDGDFEVLSFEFVCTGFAFESSNTGSTASIAARRRGADR